MNIRRHIIAQFLLLTNYFEKMIFLVSLHIIVYVLHVRGFYIHFNTMDTLHFLIIKKKRKKERKRGGGGGRRRRRRKKERQASVEK